jgi:hypothetical protein
MTNYTTAFYRSEARAEEKVLNWFRAALMWEEAIRAYPLPHGNLAKDDIQKMSNKAKTCRAMMVAD